MPGISLSLRAKLSNWRGVLRAALVGTVLVFALMLSCWRSAEAKAGDALIDFGQELSKWASLRLSDQTRVLNLNNLQIQLVSANTSLNLHDAMARLHGFCRENSGIEIPQALRVRLASGAQSAELGLLDGVYAHETDNSGVIACLDTGGRLLLDDMTARLQRFTQTRDLAALGSLRYVLARRSRIGTTLLVLWTDGKAPILDMFPSKGDAPGRDPDGIPRPEGIRRLLSAHETGLPYAVTVYESSPVSPRKLRDWYTQTLSVSGWTVRQVQDRDCVMARSGDRSLDVCFTTPSGKHALVTIAEFS